MNLIRFAYISCSAATAIAAFVAAIYWYLSSRPTPKTMLPHVASISDAPEEYILGTQVDIASIHLALLATSRLNKKAAPLECRSGVSWRADLCTRSGLNISKYRTR